jgi:hypothetical protein
MSFAALLRQILVHEQNRKLKDVAEEVGLSPRNFYGRVTGRIQFTPDELNRLLRAVPDPRLGAWLLAGTDLACTLRAQQAHSTCELDLALHGVEDSMATLRSVLHRRTPGSISADRLAEAEAHVEEAQRHLAALLGALRASQVQARSHAPA